MSEYEIQRLTLTDAQLQAVDWDEGALLVLAGPGSGKTRVLTSRIARIINSTPTKAFKILALTFTNKAADEMQSRVQSLVPEGAERASISTFHSFCMQMLQQHGSHVGLSPDFTIYSLDADRKEILRDGLRKTSLTGNNDASLVRYLQVIDKLKSALVGVGDAASKFRDPSEGENVAIAYAAYEAELTRLNALDFNSLILHAHSLVTKFEGIAARYRKTYRYWLIDEFQDTNKAQYKFLKALAGSEFRNICAVADDDQIIYQWNGASFQQMQKFQEDFAPAVFQLPTNWRCPPQIVAAANSLVSHNLIRSASKLPLRAGKEIVPSSDAAILIGSYDNEQQEADATAELIASRSPETWGESAVIARNKATLEKVKDALKSHSVPVVLAQRKDEFSSPQFCWMQAVLKQSLRKQDRRNFENLILAFNRWSPVTYSAETLASLAEGSGRALYDEWAHAVGTEPASPELSQISGWIGELGNDPTSYNQFIQKCIAHFGAENAEEASDLGEDYRAWKALRRAIQASYGKNLPLDQLLQHTALQSKEPPSPANTVTLMTVHASKGKEFDYVHVVGLAEEVMPSYYSVKAGDSSSEMEEERRNCFVAITRTKKQLVLTYARRYRGYGKKPSRFLKEMGYPQG